MFPTSTREHTDVVLSDVYERTLPSMAEGHKFTTFTNSFYKPNEGTKQKHEL